MLRQTLNILWVEDHADSAHVFGQLVRPLCKKLTMVKNCALARRAFEQDQDINLLILDLGLPDGDGCDLLRELAAIRKVPAIAMTAYVMKADRERTEAAGFAMHIAKPINFEKLRALLKRTESGEFLNLPDDQTTQTPPSFFR